MQAFYCGALLCLGLKSVARAGTEFGLNDVCKLFWDTKCCASPCEWVELHGRFCEIDVKLQS